MELYIVIGGIFIICLLTVFRINRRLTEINHMRKYSKRE